MEPNQQKLVDNNQTKILDFLVPFASEFLLYLEENNVIHSDTRSQLGKSTDFDRDTMFQTLKKLKVVDRGWAGLIGFIKKKDGKNLLILLVPETTTTKPEKLQVGIAVTVAPDLLQLPERYLNTSKGLVLLINNKYFSQQSGLSDRDGSELDYDKSIRLWRDLGYTVEPHSDLSAADIMAKIDDFAASSLHAYFHSAVVVVMSHGVLGKIHGKDGGEVDIQQFVNKLHNCLNLKDKPKMFLFQACRQGAENCGPQADAKQLQEVVTVQQVRESLAWLKVKVEHDGQQTSTYPDVIVGYSTSRGELSYRSTATGTYYVQEICEVFRKLHVDQQAQQLLDTVKNNVALKIQAAHGVSINQIAECVNNLSKPFYV